MAVIEFTQPKVNEFHTDELPIAHLCRVHHDDDQCEADPQGCRSYCSYEFSDDGGEWAPPNAPVCVVCEDMFLSDPAKAHHHS